MIFAFLFSVARLATPLVFAALGGLFSERSGVVNIALEGFMLFGAAAAAIVTLATGSPELGFLAAGIVGAVSSLLFAATVIHGRANQIVSATAVNLLAVGLIPLVLKVFYDSTGGTPTLAMDQRFSSFPMWFAIVLILVTWFLFKKTPLGLWIGFAGENPEALDAAGISVRKIRYLSVMISGTLAAWGGASLSIFLASGYSRNMTAGRGFMALAALILAKWNPPLVLLSCLFFGVMEAIQIRVQGVAVAGIEVPAQFVQMIPYLATILVLAGFLGRSRPPKAVGTLFEKE